MRVGLLPIRAYSPGKIGLRASKSSLKPCPGPAGLRVEMEHRLGKL